MSSVSRSDLFAFVTIQAILVVSLQFVYCGAADQIIRVPEFMSSNIDELLLCFILYLQ